MHPSGTAFPIDRAGSVVEALRPADAGRVQPLYEACADYFQLAYGEPPAATAAHDEFFDIPERHHPDQIHLFGLRPAGGDPLALISAVRDYPEAGAWFLGLMLVHPAFRRQGIGAQFYRAFEQWLRTEEGTRVLLAVIEPNTGGLRFWQRLGFLPLRTLPERDFRSRRHRVLLLERQLRP